MIAVISPAKTLDFESKSSTKKYSLPLHLEQSEKIINKLSGFNAKKLGKLMDISDKLAELNVERYQSWHKNFDVKNAKTAILAFKGDVYLGLEADTFKEKDFSFAQDHLLILSGLHGYLKALDLIQPYRLEMGTSIAVGKAKNLYQYWGKTVSEDIATMLQTHQDKVLINIASEEYFKVIDSKSFSWPIINCVFKDKKGSDYKMIGFFAKKARGYMAAYIVKNRVEKRDDLKNFDAHGYAFNSKMSTESTWVFTRDKPE